MIENNQPNQSDRGSKGKKLSLNQIQEILQFYLENDLTEILAKSPQNHFEASKTKFVTQGEISLNHSKSESFQKEGFLTTKIPQNYAANQDKSKHPLIDLNLKNGSTFQAIAALAKKQQNLTDSNQHLSAQTNSFGINYSMNETSKNSDLFPSLKEIIESAQNLANSAQSIAELKKIVNEFEGCSLKKMATNTVFCDGNPKSKIMVIGEAPGNNEDLQGIPFCGDSGEILTQMFRAINLHRQKDYYITNAIFWRPPGNRKPTDEELKICEPFVRRQIQLISPKIIILVGATAMSAILKNDQQISKIRGQFQDFSPEFLSESSLAPIKTFTIFHPSFLMRQPAKKKLAWLDMLNLEKFIQQNF